LRKGLRRREERTYSLIMVIAQLFSHELVHPLRVLVVAAAVDAWNYERHVGLIEKTVPV